MRIELLLTLCSGALLAAVGQVFFKVGATGRDTLAAFANPAIGVGLLCYALGTVAWIYALSKAPLTVVYPFTALTFALVYTAGIFLFHEPFDGRGAAGVVLILIGLYLVLRQ